MARWDANADQPESSFFIGEPGWTVDRLRYDFEESAPVPEPSTVLLAATGLAAAVRARRRRSLTSTWLLSGDATGSSVEIGVCPESGW